MSEIATGFAVVDALDDNLVNVLHISVIVASQNPLKYEISLSGIWEFSRNESVDLAGFLQRRVVIGTQDGIDFVNKIFKKKLNNSNLTNFVESALVEQDQLQILWEVHKEADQKKRKNLVPPKWPTWPSKIEDNSPIKILEQLGKQPYSEGTPKEMRPLVAFGKVVNLMLANWMAIEEERLRRKFLKSEIETARIWPPSFQPSAFSVN